jgi:hypothetical protein
MSKYLSGSRFGRLEQRRRGVRLMRHSGFRRGNRKRTGPTPKIYDFERLPQFRAGLNSAFPPKNTFLQYGFNIRPVIL